MDGQTFFTEGHIENFIPTRAAYITFMIALKSVNRNFLH